MKPKHTILFVAAANLIILVGVHFLLAGNPRGESVALSLLHIIGLTFGLIFLHRAYGKTAGKHKSFWLYLSIGLAFYLAGTLTWYYFEIIQGITVLSDTSYLFWLLAYIFFLVALIVRIRNTKTEALNRSYIFNIIIFMITTASIIIHYLVEPVITLSKHSMWNTLMSLAYPVMDLSILFAIITLYYLIYKRKDKNDLLLVLGGLFVHVIADSYFAYLDIMGGFYAGHPVGLLWLSSIWLIGFGGFYVTQDNKEPEPTFKETFEKSEILIPYIGTIILILLVIFSYQRDFNALSLGLLVIMIMIIVRQLYMVKENNKLIDEYRHLAYHDLLTGLNNRGSFKLHLDNRIINAKNSRIGLLLIDLDRFKVVNDTLGHQVGDSILLKTAEYLREMADSDSQIFRLGGDEFAIILTEATKKKCAGAAAVLLEKFQKPFLLNEHELIVTASIGISMYPDNGLTLDEMFRYADVAMYLAKDGGRNGFRFYDDELKHTMARKMRIESDLGKAIEKNQLQLHYQPIVELSTRKLLGMEALLRWKHTEMGWISPAEFIPIAEETGRIVSIGEWVLKTACIQNRIWQKKGLPMINISVNVSVRQFQQGNFLGILKKALHDSKLDPGFLEIEITESIMQNIDISGPVLHRIREMGVGISIDDFGTGYSSLHMIQELPINTIKLDKAFIAKITDKKQQAMIKTIIDLGKTLKLNVVAEGIENEHQLKTLIENNCTMGQGYLFSRPVQGEKFEEILREYRCQESSKAFMVPVSRKS